MLIDRLAGCRFESKEDRRSLETLTCTINYDHSASILCPPGIQLHNLSLKDCSHCVGEEILCVLGMLLLESIELLHLLQCTLRVKVTGTQELQGKVLVLQWRNEPFLFCK